MRHVRSILMVVGLCAPAPKVGAQALAPVPGPPWIKAGAPTPSPRAYKPRIEPREDWDGPAPKTLKADPEKRRRIAVHHTSVEVTKAELALSFDQSRAPAIAHLRAMQQYHRGKGWDDIAYHYVIDWQGRIWQGRPLWALGAHAGGHNDGTIGIALMGDFEHGDSGKQKPTDAQLGSLKALLAWLLDLRNTDSKHFDITAEHIHGHHAFNDTDCPGCNLEDESNPNTPLRLIRLELLGNIPRGSTPDPPARLFKRTDLGGRRARLAGAIQSTAQSLLQ